MSLASPGQEARRLLWLGTLLSPHPCGCRQVTQAQDAAGPKALLSHCCAPSSTGRSHRIGCESLVSQPLGVRGMAASAQTRETGRWAQGAWFLPPALFGEPNRQGPAATKPWGSFPVAELGLLPSLYERSGVRMLNPRGTPASQGPHTRGKNKIWGINNLLKLGENK